jgi:uncharacterized protein YkwD
MKKLFIVLLLLGTACEKKTPAVPDTDQNTEGVEALPEGPVEAFTEEQELMKLINTHRRGLGLSPLILSESLGQVVKEHSEDMADKSVAFGHSGFSSRCSLSRTLLGGGNWCGENVAMGQKTPQSAFTSWINSSGHRANIESPRATHTGIGIARSLSGTTYWTQIFIEYY